MKKQIILIILISISVLVFGQENPTTNDYEVSKLYSTVEASTKDYFTDGKNVLSVKVLSKAINDNFQVLLQKYNIEKMNYASKNRYHDFPENFSYEGTIQAQDKYYFFYSSWIGKGIKQERLFCREIDFKEGVFKGEAELILAYNGKLANIKPNSKFDILMSKDKSKILIQYQKKPIRLDDVDNYDSIEFAIFDTSLNSIWKKLFTLPYPEYKIRLFDTTISNNAAVFVVAKVFDKNTQVGEINKENDKINYHLEFYKIDNNDSFFSAKIILDDKFINNLKIEESNNTVFCAGFYNIGREDFEDIDGFEEEEVSDETNIIIDKSKFTKGLYTFKIDIENNIVTKKYYEIPLEILNQYVTERKKNRNIKNKETAAFKFLKLQKFNLYNDGMIIIGEVNYFKKNGFNTENIRKEPNGLEVAGMLINPVFVESFVQKPTIYENILISKIDFNGDLKWMRKIPKRQKNGYGEKGGMSFSYFKTNGIHYLTYLDNIKNKDLALDKKPAWHSDHMGGVFTIVKINDNTGELSKDYVFDMKRIERKVKGYLFNTNSVIKINDKSYFLEIYKGKKEDFFLKVNY